MYIGPHHAGTNVESGIRGYAKGDLRGSIRDYRSASESECEARVSPSHKDWWSSVGLVDPGEYEEEEPMVHSSVSAFGPPRRSASA